MSLWEKNKKKKHNKLSVIYYSRQNSHLKMFMSDNRTGLVDKEYMIDMKQRRLIKNEFLK